MDKNQIFPNLLTQIINAKDIDELIGIYEMIINSDKWDSAQYMKEVNKYINNIHMRASLLFEKCPTFKKDYNSDISKIISLKKKLINMLTLGESHYNYQNQNQDFNRDSYGK